MEKILFVDDDEKFLNLYEKKFSNKYEIHTAKDAKSAIKMLNHNDSFAVIIADMFMPEINGIEFLEKVKDKSPDSIRIIITGECNLDIAIQAINRGNVFHFLTKPCTKEEIKSILDSGIEKYKETVSLKRKSMFDELTKVHNRHYFEITIPELFNKSNRSTDKFSLVFIDVNYLKDINDRYGHNVGDEMIVTIARVLKDMTRENDIVARFGGDEFVIYAYNTDNIGANSLVKRIKDVLIHKKLKHCSHIKLSIAAGIATYPDDGKSYQLLLKIADKKMYLDKENEKNLNPIPRFEKIKNSI